MTNPVILLFIYYLLYYLLRSRLKSNEPNYELTICYKKYKKVDVATKCLHHL